MTRTGKTPQGTRPAGGRSGPGAKLLGALFLVIVGIDVAVYLWFKGCSPDRKAILEPTRKTAAALSGSNVTVNARRPGPGDARHSTVPERIAALQVALDRLGFSPGVIDGQFGSQTRVALVAWQMANSLKPTGELDVPSSAIIDVPEHPYGDYTITADDWSQLGDVPGDWRERSQRSRMPYETILELVAEKFHSKEAFIRQLNPQVIDWTVLQSGQSIRVPECSSVGRTRPPKASRLRVYLGSKYLRAYDDDGRIIAHFPCSIAAREEKRPIGLLTVESVVLNPDYTFDPSIFPELEPAQKSYGKLIVPPGPNNPVGIAWIGLSQPGYGIHGTPHPEQIGRTESHGCFRLANWNAERLAHMVVLGTPVEVVPE